VRYSPVVLALGLCAGCALKGDVRQVELQVQALKTDLARAESTSAAERDSILAAVLAVQRTLAAQQAYLVQLRGEVKTDMLALATQIVAVQELTGQSQQRLTELRRRLEERAGQPVPQPADAAALPVGPSGNPAGPGPDQMYDVSLQQFRRGSLATARLGFREFLRVFPTHERAPDAWFYVAETFTAAAPDSAAAMFESLVKAYPNSPRTPAALYKLGLLAEQRSDRAGARAYYQRVVTGYPRSDEANLARDKLSRLGT
jgi:tol-pal system protein YbgF